MSDLWSDEMMSVKRGILMDMIQGCLTAPRKESSAEVWKLHIDGALDRLEAEVYLPSPTNKDSGK